MPSATELKRAYECATAYYLARGTNEALPKKEAIAKKLGYDPAKFGTYLRIAWEENMVDIMFFPPNGIGDDYHSMKELELDLLKVLQKESPQYVDPTGARRKHKLWAVHVVPTVAKSAGPDEKSAYESATARVCRRAADAFLDLIRNCCERNCEADLDDFYIGIAWSRTCQRVLNLMPLPDFSCSNLVAVPLVGLMGHRELATDANFLAWRLGAKLGGSSRKIPFPCIRRQGMPLNTLRKINSIKRALDDVGKTQVAMSGVGAAYYKHKKYESKLVARNMITPDELNELKIAGAVAELNGHYFDAHGKAVSTWKNGGFAPVGVTVPKMQNMDNFLVCVTPDEEKVKAVISIIRAGIPSELALDHNMAYALKKQLQTISS